MSRKIELTPDQVYMCLTMYNDELLGSTTISEKMGIHKTIIIRTLKENGIIVGPSGRRNIGGRVKAQERYNNKPGVKIKKAKTHKEWVKGKKEELKIYNQQWNKDNREHVNKYKRDYERKRRAEDPKYRLGIRTRTAVWQLLKERNINKTNKTFVLLGYTIEELMNHLEKQFTEGMTWDNYGEWHVDHKKPMTLFEFTSTDDEGFKECWKLENLQPLWGKDNLSKGPRYL
jgi:hypothetical protein